MKIGIDISQTVYEGTGTAMYTSSLVNALKNIDQKNEYVYFGSSLRRRQPGFWPMPPTVLDLMWNQLHKFPVENFVGKIDIFHSSDWTQPPTKAKKITTVHDLVVFKYPDSSHPKIIETQKRRLEWVKKECDAIIADSKATKTDIVDVLKIPEEKIKVIPLAASDDYVQFNGEKYKNKKPYILAVGTREPRKNFNRLIAAIKLLNLKDYDLIVAGKQGWEKQELPDGAKILGYVDQKLMPGLYAGADLFVYPSLYEGFGIPILEAMTVGCPVAASNVSSMPEVGGEAAVYFDPLDVNDMADKIKLALKEENKLRKKSLAQASKFSWEKTAKETLAVYEQLVS